MTQQQNTAKQIARMLEVTPRTVAFHIENALHKLQVSDKYLAIIKAQSMGWL